MGGFFGERKNEIMDMVPNEYKCRESLFKAHSMPSKTDLEKLGIEFPLFVKPNVGERGFEVRELKEWKELELYATKGFDYIVQEKLNQDLELGILFHRTLGGGRISSLCIKEFMQVKGDGQRTIAQLVQEHPRHCLYLKALEADKLPHWDHIPLNGQLWTVHKIGNHSKGTRFRNGNKQISARMNAALAEMFRQIKGLDYGRFDIKTESLAALENGQFKVFELNGVSAEPAHIYDYPNVFLAYASLYKHWFTLGRLAKQNIKKGVKTTPLTKFISQIYRHFFT